MVKIMILSISGDGKINGNLVSVKKHGNTCIQIQELSIKCTTSWIHIKLDDLLHRDKALGKSIMKIQVLVFFSEKIVGYIYKENQNSRHEYITLVQI